MTLDLSASLPAAPAAPAPSPITVAPIVPKDELADEVAGALLDIVGSMHREFVADWKEHLLTLAEELARLARHAAAVEALTERDLEHIRAVSYRTSARVIIGESNRFSRSLTDASTAMVRLLVRLIAKVAL